jgi:hypothetical protein
LGEVTVPEISVDWAAASEDAAIARIVKAMLENRFIGSALP